MKRSIRHIFIPGILIFILSCNSNHDKNHNHMHTTKDDLHREMELPVRLVRVMSLTPSITEILYEVTSPAKIVGRTPHCNFPTEVIHKPAVNCFPLDLEKLISLKPQLVFAKADMLAMHDAQKIENAGIHVYYLKYLTCQDIVNSIAKVGKLMDEDTKASLIADKMTMRLHQLKKEADLKEEKPKVLILISHDPLYVFGINNFASDMLSYAGAQNAVTDSLTHPFPLVNREYLLKINPDMIIELGDKNSLTLGLFDRYPELKNVNAYKNNKLLTIHEDLVSRPGPRVIEGILALKKMIHPNEK